MLESEETDRRAEQSDRSHILEHHMKIQQLERKVVFLQGEIDRMQERRREVQKTTMIFCTGIAYGLILVWIFS